MSSRLAEFILKNNVSGIQKTFRTMLEQHFSKALRKQVITENEDATPLEPQIINILITAAHESRSHNYKYETGLFSADFNLKSDVLEFIEFVNDYYWVRHYEVDMEINDSMTSIDMESLPDDAEGNFSVHVTIDSSIIRYPKGYVTEKTDIDTQTIMGADCQADCKKIVGDQKPIYLSPENFIGKPYDEDLEGKRLWSKMSQAQKDAAISRAKTVLLKSSPKEDATPMELRIWAALDASDKKKLIQSKGDNKDIIAKLKDMFEDTQFESDCNEDDYITEAAAKRTVVFRDGKKTTVMQCPPGHIYNAASKKCRKMSTTELKNRHKAGLKAARELKSQIPAISKKRNKTDKLRRKALKIHAMAKTSNQ